MERLTEKNASWFTEELYVDACKPSDNDIESLYRKLKRYEDLQEQGRLIELPCGIGDTLYSNIGYRYARAINSPYPCKVVFIGTNEQYKFFNVVYKDETMRQFNEDELGNSVFLTKEEAEQTLSK